MVDVIACESFPMGEDFIANVWMPARVAEHFAQLRPVPQSGGGYPDLDELPLITPTPRALQSATHIRVVVDRYRDVENESYPARWHVLGTLAEE